MEFDGEAIEASELERHAMEAVWTALGPLMSSALSRLSREQCLGLCNAMSVRTAEPEWIIRPGYIRCSILDQSGAEVYSFEFQTSQRVAFAYNEPGHAN